MGGHALLGLGHRQAIEGAAVGRAAVPVPGLGHHRSVEGRALGLDDHPHGQPVLAGELEVALVVGRHRHDRAGAVAHQHEVADPDRDALAAEGVRGVAPGEDALLLQLAGLPLAPVLGAQPLHGGAGLGGGLGHQLVDARVLGRQHHEGGAVDGVDARGEDAQGGAALDREVDLGPVRAADPVALLREHALRPGLQVLHVVEQLVLVGRDAQEPLLHPAFLHLALAAPADAALGLLVGQHRLAGGAPVDGGLGAVGDAALEHAQEEPLVPAVVLRVAGGDLAAPGVAEAQPLQLGLHAGDVLAGPGLRVQALLDGGVLGRQPQRVPADGVHDVEAAHALVARHHVRDGVVAHVPHVDVARRVGQHLEAIELGPRGVLVDLERAPLAPASLPARLDLLEVVLAHGSSVSAETSNGSTRARRPRATDARRTGALRPAPWAPPAAPPPARPGRAP